MGSREHLGSGWKFPLQVDRRGGIATERQEAKVEESIFIILSTAKGERMMNPEFGCGIHDLLFAPNNAQTRSIVTDEVRRALVSFEPRADILSVRVESAPEESNVLLIRVDYRVRSTNTVKNLVHPFYLTEGT